MGQRPQKQLMIVGKRAKVYLHSSEAMDEIEPGSARLLIGASVFLEGAEWSDYLRLYHQVYCEEGLVKLQDDGYLVVIQTDAYKNNQVIPRNAYLTTHLIDNGYDLIDTKVWKRTKLNFYQPPFSLVWVFRKRGMVAVKRPTLKEYRYGVWDYPMTAGGALNSWPMELCRLLVSSFTAKGDLIVDPFCGTGTLLRVAGHMGRRGAGYEINPELIPTITKNIAPKSNLF